MKVLDHRQVLQKIRRLAIEILEHNHDEPEIILAGINNNGYGFAQMLLAELQERTDKTIQLTHIRLNPANPLASPITIELPVESLQNKVIIIVDDVANTGRTIFYACRPIIEVLPKKVEVAVLVDRTHKSFPIRVDYVGLSLATTLKEDIEVQIREVSEYAVYLN